ncbi:hypothetical protein [Chitinophaga sp. S165]|uniref:hypothetical protein n=1 Tax=Chitinophaga sp. S165 TaxID=2135462 RepID=UPI000D71CC2D|nr:hypothetical protein [Chitinophaga sp. S165]PWV45936.1 hypothetical protein C7475_112154 [Chitinophaga sp. S165]
MLGLDGLSSLGAAEEYNNAGALFGLDGLEGEELLGALKRMNPIKRQRTINKLASPASPSKGSRAEMEKHFNEIPAYIQAGLKSGDLRLADTMIYSIKPVSSRTIKLWEPQDDREVGLRNISNAKLPKNQALLVSGITLLAGTSADATKDKIVATDFKALEGFPAIVNGEFNLKANKKQLVPETSIAMFKTNSFHFVPIGYYKLSNPRLIVDDVLIEATVELGTQDGIPANTYIYCSLHGTITTP